MKAWQCDDSRPTPGLICRETEPPKVQPDEILVRVHAVGVTPPELKWTPTTHTKSGGTRSNAVPGHDFSGIVAAVGDRVDARAAFAVGQEIFGMNDWFSDGATAEFCCTLPSMIAEKPARLSHAEAASIPIGALTAWQGLFDHAKLQAGERVLIHGGSGAVGVLAIQLARQRGAHVITTASTRHREFLLQLGASQVIDYHDERFDDLCKDIDVVFDGVGGETLQRSWAVLRLGGRLVTIASSSELTQDERTKAAFFIVSPNQQQLREIAHQLDAGHLLPVVDRIVPFDQAASAYTRPTVERQGRGKTVVAAIPST